MDELIEKRIRKAIEERVFPGCVVGIVKEGKKQILPFGRLTYENDSPLVTAETLYDLASITKAIPTNSLALKLIDEGKLSLEDRLIDYLPEYEDGWREEIKIKHLMTYTMILETYAPLSTHMNDSPEEIIKFITHCPLQARPGEKFLYTNSPSILLGMVIERVYTKKLEVIAQEELFEPLRMRKTRFGKRDITKEIVAPTEISETRGVVQGIVHDEVSFAMQRGGRAVGCAGVFSTADDLLTFGQMLLNQGEWQGRRYFSPKAIELMHTNQLSEMGTSYGLGWELNQKRFMGEKCSDTFGKTGFTGTVILINIREQRAMVLLANATYPKRKAGGEEINQVRHDVAEIIFREQ